MAKVIKRTILITAFDSFGGESINPSWMAVSALPDEICGWTVRKVQLSTAFGKAEVALAAAMKEFSPDAVICTGQAGGSNGIRLERVAINLIDARIPDNDGARPVDELVVKDGPAAYFTELPVKLMLERLGDSHIQAEISNSAGTFVCNTVMYYLLHLIRRKYKKVRGGFIHVPYIPDQTADKPEGTPSMSLDKITDALIICAATLIESIEESERKKSGKSRSPTANVNKPRQERSESEDSGSEENNKKAANGPGVIEKGAAAVHKNAPVVKREIRKLAKNPIVRDAAFEALESANKVIPSRKVRRVISVALRAARIHNAGKGPDNGQQ